MPITQTTLTRWEETERAFLREVRADLSTRRYFFNRCLVPQKDRAALKTAQQARYLVLPARGTRNITRLVWAYQAYCEAKGRPLLFIEPRQRSPYMRVIMDLETLSPFGAQNLYEPDLDTTDTRFRAFVKFAKYYTVGQTLVILHQVRATQAGALARELLAWYDRCAAARKQEVDDAINLYQTRIDSSEASIPHIIDH